jgi:hypothetical protein
MLEAVLRAPVWWLVVGAALGFGIISILTVGRPFIILAAAMIVAGVSMPWTRNRSAHLIFVGAAVAPVTLAWLNREGPGTVCTTAGSLTRCTDQWSPWPFLAVAVALVTAGLVMAGRRRDPGGA